MGKQIGVLVLLAYTSILSAANLVGVVCDVHRVPMPYASVFLKGQPQAGSVTNSKGVFEIAADNATRDVLIVSFLGYETQQLPMANIRLADTLRVFLREQPIELEETVVSAPTQRRNRKKTMADLLALVRQRMDVDFPETMIKYRIVSNARLYSQNEMAAFDHVVAQVVEAPGKGYNHTDSIQYMGEMCKRYINPQTQQRIRSLAANEAANRSQKRLLSQVEDSSSVPIHAALWRTTVKSEFDELAKHPRRWTLTRENEHSSVLTYTDKQSFLLGIVKLERTCHYIVDSYNYSLQKVSQNYHIKAAIPFGYKFRPEHLLWLNVLNMSSDDIEKFRAKRVNATMKQNVIFEQTKTGVLLKERSMAARAVLEGSNGIQLPLRVEASAKVVQVQTDGVRFFSRRQLRPVVPQIVETP